jgi:hypothetical protein
MIRIPNTDHRYADAAADVIAGGGDVELNEYGCWRSIHWCATCGRRFTLCPPTLKYGPDCVMNDCPSYDPARDFG